MSRFRVGEVYDMGTSLASYLLACGLALPVADERPARVVPLDEEEDRFTTLAADRATAADSPSAKKS